MVDQWRRQEWETFQLGPHRMSVFISEVIELAFEPTFSDFILDSKRKLRKKARMSLYNAVKFTNKVV